MLFAELMRNALDAEATHVDVTVGLNEFRCPRRTLDSR